MCNTMYGNARSVVATEGKTDEQIHNDALAHVSHRLIHDVGLQANTSYRHGLQGEAGDRQRLIKYNGRWITPIEADQIERDERFAMQVQQGAVAVVDPMSHPAVRRRERQNGLSNRAVDQAIKESGGLTSAAMSKGGQSLGFAPPPWWMPLSGEGQHEINDLTHSPVRVLSPFAAEHHEPSAIPNQPPQHMPTVPSPALTQGIGEALHRQLKFRLAPIARVDRTMMPLYHRLFDPVTPGHVEAFVGGELQNGRDPSELQGDGAVTELQVHLRKAFFPTPSK